MVAVGNKGASKSCSGREILTAALKEVLKKPLFTDSAEKLFCHTPFIEEKPTIVPKPVTKNSQTDAFVPLAPPKPFVAQKVGCDVSAQVDNSLVFNLDFEVAPLVNALVSKTLEQVSLELHEETTLAKIRAFKTAACARRDAEISSWEAQVAVEAERREAAEKSAAALEAVRRDDELRSRRKFLAEFSSKFLASLVPTTLHKLQRDYGVFENEKMLEIERKFLPSLLSQIRTVQRQSSDADSVVARLLNVAIKH